MTTDPLILAYLAGVVDSDGYITVHRSRRAGKAYYAARVGIAGTRREPHDLAASLWGGKVAPYRPKNPRHRVQYQWSHTGDAAYLIIQELFPYLRIKQAQAAPALEIQEDVWAGRGDDPFPWFGPGYDPDGAREEIRAEVVEVLNQDRRAKQLPAVAQ